jgi:hypothetical protein
LFVFIFRCAVLCSRFAVQGSRGERRNELEHEPRSEHAEE